MENTEVFEYKLISWGKPERAYTPWLEEILISYFFILGKEGLVIFIKGRSHYKRLTRNCAQDQNVLLRYFDPLEAQFASSRATITGTNVET